VIRIDDTTAPNPDARSDTELVAFGAVARLVPPLCAVRASSGCLLLTSGRPIVLLPPQGAPAEPRPILLAWNARPEAVRAVAGAMPLLNRADAAQIVVVDDEGTPGYGEEAGVDIAEHPARHGVCVDVLRLWRETLRWLRKTRPRGRVVDPCRAYRAAIASASA
jgi:hypothetical protein